MLTWWGARPERAEAPSPGHRPGLLWAQPCRPVRAKALKLVIDYCLSSNDDAKIRQFPDTTKFQRVIRRDFQHAFNPKPVKQSNSPFCAPQLILFQKRKHRVEHLNTLSTTNNKIQKAIRNLPQFLSSSVPQFFSDPSLLSLFRSLLYI